MNSLDDILKQAQNAPPCRPVVAGAAHHSTLDALASARRRTLVEQPVLVGDEDSILEQLELRDERSGDYRIVSPAGDNPASRAVELIADGAGDVLLKGGIATSDLLRAVLTGLDTHRRLSDVLVTEYVSNGGPRLIGVADGGVNVAPDIEAKRQIIENSVHVFRQLGFDTPRVALLCAVEKMIDSMPHTVQASQLAERMRAYDNCIVDGPLALDNALSEQAAKAKGIDSPVAGHADILVAPTVEAGNILGKAFQYLAGRRVAHLIGGASVPILIPSRTEDPADRVRSLALAVHCTEPRR